jgi:Ca-activated chloride channel family protein
MTFQWASLLWLLFLVPVLVLIYLWAQRRRKKFAVRYASLLLVKDALGKGPGFRRHIPAVLFLLGVTVGIIALARPYATVSLPSNRGTVILAVDISGSMRATDIQPSRMDAAKEAAQTFVNKQPPRVRVGVVAFSGTADLVQAPTGGREDIIAAINRLHTQRGTAIGSGILVALDSIFEDTEKQQQPSPDAVGAPLVPTDPTPEPPPVPPGSNTSAVIVLLTDGQSNQGPDPLEAAQKAADRGIRIFTVGIGTEEGATIGFEGRSFRVGLDENTLNKIAQNTAGAYYKAESEDQLVGIYRMLSTRLIVGRDQIEVTALFTAVALGVILLGAVLSVAWFAHLP